MKFYLFLSPSFLSLSQVIGRRWTEELVLHAMEELEAARKEHGSFKLELIC